MFHGMYMKDSFVEFGISTYTWAPGVTFRSSCVAGVHLLSHSHWPQNMLQ